MRGLTFGIAAIVLGAGSAMAAPGELLLPLAGKIAPYAASEEDAGAVPEVERGQRIDIACADAGNANAEVRVVMDVVNTEAPTGFGRVLATDSRVSRGRVHVRVPDMPGLSNHTVTVKVFVMKADGAHVCEAGRVKVS